MAGTAGFEPTHDRIKTCCLTAWRRPNKMDYALIANKRLPVKLCFYRYILHHINNNSLFLCIALDHGL